MTAVLPAEILANGFLTRKRSRMDDPDLDLEEIRIKRARKDSHENTPTPSPSNGKVTALSFHHDFLASSKGPVPATQDVLLLHATKQPYSLTPSYAVPKLSESTDEVLIEIQTIGLNPIDWKAPDFGFGIPELPYIAGRDLVGTIVSVPPSRSSLSSRPLKVGDLVFSGSTDYRDLRKAAYQEYVIASRYNVCRIPSNVNREAVAGLAVAFIAAVLAVGVCWGSDFSALDEDVRGPDVKKILHGVGAERLPKDVRDECMQDIEDSERPKKGDWVAIWGGSSTTALYVAQLCKILGLRVIEIVDVGKHGGNLSQGPADLLVDSHDPERAIEIVRKVTDNKLRFAIDTVGKPTAELLRRTLLHADCEDKSGSVETDSEPTAHLIGMTGLPKVLIPGIKQHTVPIKVHHEVPEIGEALMQWLEVLLRSGKITPPDVEVVDGGLKSVNGALDRMRRGEVAGRRLAVKLS